MIKHNWLIEKKTSRILSIRWTIHKKVKFKESDKKVELAKKSSIIGDFVSPNNELMELFGTGDD